MAQKQLEEHIRRGMEFTLLNQFDRADSVFQRLIQQYPEEPFGYFYVAANLQAWMLDREDFSRLGLFEYYLQQALQRCDSLQARFPEDPWLYFYRGSAYLYRSFLKSKLRKWWGAYRDARKGVHALEQALALDSTLYDAYLGIGSFKYWKSAKAGVLRFLPLIRDERQEGIRMVKQAIARGRFVRWVGRDQLVWIYLDQQKWEEAIRLARENLAAYPGSRFFLWSLVETLDRAGRDEEALALYQELLGQIRQLPENNRFNELHCLVRMAQIQLEMARYETADSLAQEALKISLPDYLAERARSRLEAAREIRRECRVHVTKEKLLHRRNAAVLPTP